MCLLTAYDRAQPAWVQAQRGRCHQARARIWAVLETDHARTLFWPKDDGLRTDCCLPFTVWARSDGWGLGKEWASVMWPLWPQMTKSAALLSVACWYGPRGQPWHIVTTSQLSVEQLWGQTTLEGSRGGDRKVEIRNGSGIKACEECVKCGSQALGAQHCSLSLALCD